MFLNCFYVLWKLLALLINDCAAFFFSSSFNYSEEEGGNNDSRSFLFSFKYFQVIFVQKWRENLCFQNNFNRNLQISIQFLLKSSSYEIISSSDSNFIFKSSMFCNQQIVIHAQLLLWPTIFLAFWSEILLIHRIFLPPKLSSPLKHFFSSFLWQLKIKLRSLKCKWGRFWQSFKSF